MTFNYWKIQGVVLTILIGTVWLSGVTADTIYKVGVVPQFEARRLHLIWQPILNHLEKETGLRFELVGSPTIPAFEAEFLDGEFDFVYLNPYHLLMAQKTIGYRPLVRDVGKTLHGILVVKRNGSISDVSDLQGKVIAFPAPNALGASLQMRQELTDLLGLEFSSRYVKTHDSVYLNVLLGEADAGGGVLKTLNQQKPMIKDHLKIIHTTKPVPPHPFAVHPHVPADVTESVTRSLLALGETETGKAMLALIPIQTIGRATIADYQILDKMGLERFYVKSH